MYGTDLENIYKQYQNDKRNITPLEEEKNLENFGIAFTYDSNRIEGGSLTKNETKALILHDQAPRRPLKDILETKAHYKLIKKIREEKRVLNLELVLEWHYTMFKDTDKEIAGNMEFTRRTAAFHRVSILKKLEIKSVIELAKLITSYDIAIE